MALSDACKEAIYLRRSLEHMGLTNLVIKATTMFCDNQSTIQLSRNCVYLGRVKHIDIRYHFSREASENGEIKIEHIKTDLMLADIMTKALPSNKHAKCVKMLNLSL